MSIPKISIIVPIYNSGKYLDSCLRSIQNQTFTEFECIMINDGSNDNSEDICKRYLTDNRFHLISKKNEGVSIARNTGIIAAKGEFLQFVDSDDLITTEMSDVLYQNMYLNDVDCVICGVQSFKNDESKIIDLWTEKRGFYSKNQFLEIIKKWTVNPYIGGPYNKLFKREIILDNKILYENGTSFGEDIVFNFKYWKFCKNIYITDTALYKYRRDVSTSLTRMKYKFKDYYKRSLDIYSELELAYYDIGEKERKTCLNEFLADLYFRIFKKYSSRDIYMNKKVFSTSSISNTRFYHKYLILFTIFLKFNWILFAIIYVKLLTFIYLMRLKKRSK